jgi:hypothetical protein
MAVADPALDDEALCEPRERASAILAIIAAFLLALCVVLAAVFAPGGGGLGGDGAGGNIAGSGIGQGTGSGIGAGNGTGSGIEGDGPGAGEDGRGRPADGPDEFAPPPGDPNGTAEAVAAADTGAGEPVEVPRFSFKLPDEPVPPKVATSTTQAQIANIVEAFPNSRVGINLDATSSMESSRNAVAQVIPEIFERIQAGSIAVSTFRDRLIGEPNTTIIKPTTKTKRKSDIDAMIQKVLDVPTDGGGDAPETGYQLVIENMKRNQYGTKARPNIEFIITDAPEKEPQLLSVMLSLMQKTRTRVFVIRVDSDPPVRTEVE